MGTLIGELRYALRQFRAARVLTVLGVTPPGFYGETLRADPPDLWIPIHKEPLINGDTSLLRQSVGAWLRVIGRLRPGATTRLRAAALETRFAVYSRSVR